MPRKYFDQKLDALNHDMTELGAEVDAVIGRTLEALRTLDRDLAQQVVEGDSRIDQAEHRIEQVCMNLLALQQPIASDLRMVSSILKVVTDIERIGDHASDIAELVLRLSHTQLETYSGHIQPMITASREMVHSAVSAFIARDREKSALVIQSDDVVDELFNKVKHDIVQRLKASGEEADEYVDVLMIAKYLERIGDHAVNICEWEIFKETGSIQDTRIL